MPSVKKTVKRLAKQGRGQDSLLAHINPREAMILKAAGGSGVKNPKTGILEFDDGWGGGGGDGGDGGNGWGGGGWGGSAGWGGWGGGDGGDWGGGDATGGGSSLGAGWGLGTGEFGGSDSWSGSPGADAGWGGWGMGSGEFGGSDSWSGETVGPSWGTDASNEFGVADNWDGTNDGPLTKLMKNPMFKGVMAIASKANPAVAAANLAMNAYGAYSQGKLGQYAGSTVGSNLGATAGSAFGPMGAAVGGYFGGKAGAGLGQGVGSGMGSSGPGTGTGSGNSFGRDAMSTLLGFYAGNKASQNLKGQINNLNNLFSPGGVYAQQLRQTLERKDAAAGRRSQYGPREAQLMATLADRAAASTPQLQKLYEARDQNRAQMLRSGLAMYDRMGGINGIRKGVGEIADYFRGTPTPSFGGYTPGDFGNYTGGDFGGDYDFGGF